MSGIFRSDYSFLNSALQMKLIIMLALYIAELNGCSGLLKIL